MRNVSGHTSQETHTHVLTHKVQEEYCFFLLGSCRAEVQCTHTETIFEVYVSVFTISPAIAVLNLLTLFSACETDRGGLDEKQVQQVVKRQSATEREVIKTMSVDCKGLTQLFSHSLSPLSSRQPWNENETIIATSVPSCLSWLWHYPWVRLCPVRPLPTVS